MKLRRACFIARFMSEQQKSTAPEEKNVTCAWIWDTPHKMYICRLRRYTWEHVPLVHLVMIRLGKLCNSLQRRNRYTLCLLVITTIKGGFKNKRRGFFAE